MIKAEGEQFSHARLYVILSGRPCEQWWLCVYIYIHHDRIMKCHNRRGMMILRKYIHVINSSICSWVHSVSFYNGKYGQLKIRDKNSWLNIWFVCSIFVALKIWLLHYFMASFHLFMNYSRPFILTILLYAPLTYFTHTTLQSPWQNGANQNIRTNYKLFKPCSNRVKHSDIYRPLEIQNMLINELRHYLFNTFEIIFSVMGK